MILAADISGSKTRLALFDTYGNDLKMVADSTSVSTEHKSLEDAIRGFTSSEGVAVDRACIGVAGPVKNVRCESSNLAWAVDGKSLAKRLRIESVSVINDVEAFAYGIDAMKTADLVTLNEGTRDSEGNTAVISAGSGLGEAGLYWDGFRHHPFATEGGHSDFAPRNDVEIELLRYLLKKNGRASYENILSGPGLQNVYEFLRDGKKAEEPKWLRDQIGESKDPPAAISAAGLEGKAPIASQALDIFVSVYAAEAGNVALNYLSTAGLYIGGGIAPKILHKLQEPAFMKTFSAKGRMQGLLESIPVRVVLNQQAGLIGAARCALVDKAFGTLASV